jgi:hypothetical protein
MTACFLGRIYELKANPFDFDHTLFFLLSIPCQTYTFLIKNNPLTSKIRHFWYKITLQNPNSIILLSLCQQKVL